MNNIQWMFLGLTCAAFVCEVSFANPILIAVEDENEDTVDPYRLSGIVLPIRYDVDLIVQSDFYTTKSFQGSVQILLYAAIENVTNIVLHSSSINYTTISVFAQNDTNATNLFSDYELREDYEEININLIEPLQVNVTYIVTATNYTAVLHEDMYGFYISSYTDNNNTEQWVATTQFQTTYARRAFPSFDEPNFKAVFQISIARPADYNTLSNTNKESTSPSETIEGLVKDVYLPTPIMPTYLIAFIVSKFEAYEGSNETYGVWSREEALDTAEYSFLVGPPLLHELEVYVNFSYLDSGIGKMEQVAIPDFAAGAMENWGLCTYRETALLWDENESTAANKQRVATVVAHEFAHMWFGDLVTLDWWSFTWLNEGFATYFQYFATAKVETTWELEYQFIVEQQQTVFVADALTGALPLSSNVSSPSEIMNKFATISYNKGGAVIRMMRNFIGEEAFQNSLQTYISENQFKNTKPSDLWAALEQQRAEFDSIPENLTLTEIMTGWTEQAGYPVVTLSLVESDGVLTQERFLLDQNQTSDFKWDVPISYTISHGPNFTSVTPQAWLLASEDELRIPNILHGGTGWVVINIQESGYYRVNYDDTLWEELQAGLTSENFGQIHVLNRAQIVDDAFNLARANIISYIRALEVTSFLVNETLYYPWYAAFNAFTFLRRRINPDSETGNYLELHIQTLSSNLYESVSFDIAANTSHVDILRTALALQWACELDEEACIKRSIELFNSYRENDTTINPNIRSVVYCTALRNSETSENWDFLWNKFTESNLATEQALIITALGCARDEAILNDYLNKSITPGSGIRRQDANTVFSAVLAGNLGGINIGLAFLQDNFEGISENYGGMNALSSVINGIADRITTQQQVDALFAFIDDNQAFLADAAHQAQSALETAQANIAWVQANEEELQSWFSDTYGEDGDGDDDGGASTFTLSVSAAVAVIITVFFNLH